MSTTSWSRPPGEHPEPPAPRPSPARASLAMLTGPCWQRRPARGAELSLSALTPSRPGACALRLLGSQTL